MYQYNLFKIYFSKISRIWIAGLTGNHIIHFFRNLHKFSKVVILVYTATVMQMCFFLSQPYQHHSPQNNPIVFKYVHPVIFNFLKHFLKSFLKCFLWDTIKKYMNAASECTIKEMQACKNYVKHYCIYSFYSLDLTPCDILLFPKCKISMKCKHSKFF